MEGCLLGLFELSMIFQDLRNMASPAVDLNINSNMATKK